eukprot:jgi/Tetstr1/446205/TSEL_033750.t1
MARMLCSARECGGALPRWSSGRNDGIGGDPRRLSFLGWAAAMSAVTPPPARVRRRPPRGSAGRAYAAAPGSNAHGVQEAGAEQGRERPADSAAGLLVGLSAEQQGVVLAPQAAALRVVAGPGSGKTRVLTTRVAHLLEQGLKPWQVLAITFTNKSARELKSRLADMMDPIQAGLITTGTFHSVAQRMIRREIQQLPEAARRGLTPSFTILDADDSKKLLAGVIKELDPTIEQVRSQARKYQLQISNLKNSSEWGLDGNKAEAAFLRSARGRLQMKVQLGAVVDRYEAALRANNAMDFDDILPLAVAILRHCPSVLEYYQARWKHVLVDEFQDTNSGQYEFVRLLASARGEVFVVGDPDQAIYSWRGADVDNMVNNMEVDFRGVMTLQLRDNYRSTSTICAAADAVIRNGATGIQGRTALRARLGAGAPIRLITAADDREEAAAVASAIGRLANAGTSMSDMAVLFRANAQAKALEDALIQAGVPYRLESGVKYWSRIEVKDLVMYLRLVASPTDNLALLRVINVPARKLGSKSVERLAAWAEARGCTLAQALLGDLEGAPTLPDLPSAKELGVTAAARKGVAQLREAVWSARRVATAESDPSVVLDQLIQEVGYLDWVMEGRCGEGDEEQRWQNVEQLLDTLKELPEKIYADTFPALRKFVNEVTLQTDEDTAASAEAEGGAVRLMTLHAAKGLEFPVVFIAGCEEGLLPMQWGDNVDDTRMEEERRLFYVGITRAEQQLILSHAMRRMRPVSGAGMMGFNVKPSPYLRDIERAVRLEPLRSSTKLRAPRMPVREVGQQRRLASTTPLSAARSTSPAGSVGTRATFSDERPRTSPANRAGAASTSVESARASPSEPGSRAGSPTAFDERTRAPQPSPANGAGLPATIDDERHRPLSPGSTNRAKSPAVFDDSTRHSSLASTSLAGSPSAFDENTRAAFGSTASRSWDEIERQFLAAEAGEAALLSSSDEEYASLLGRQYYSEPPRADLAEPSRMERSKKTGAPGSFLSMASEPPTRKLEEPPSSNSGGRDVEPAHVRSSTGGVSSGRRRSKPADPGPPAPGTPVLARGHNRAPQSPGRGTGPRPTSPGSQMPPFAAVQRTGRISSGWLAMMSSGLEAAAPVDSREGAASPPVECEAPKTTQAGASRNAEGPPRHPEQILPDRHQQGEPATAAGDSGDAALSAQRRDVPDKRGVANARGEPPAASLAYHMAAVLSQRAERHQQHRKGCRDSGLRDQ